MMTTAQHQNSTPLAPLIGDETMLSMSTFVRFPLMVVVLLSHAYISGLRLGGDVDIFLVTSFSLSKLLGNMAVPCFLFISGYLFFRNTEQFSVRLYGDKLRRRAQRLLLPYVVWNLLIILLYFVGQTLVPQLFSGTHTAVANYSVAEWFNAFWCVEGTQSPINPPLWYIRDLMVIVMFSPAIYLALRNRWVGVGFIALMLGLWLSGEAVNGAIVWLQPKNIFFFSLGAWYAIHKVEFMRFRWVTLLLGVALCVTFATGFYLCGGKWVKRLFYEETILFGSLSILYLSHFLASVKRWRVPKYLGDSYFFVYLCHYIPMALLSKVLVKLVAPTTNVEFFAIYFGSFIVILVLSVGAYHLLRRLLPKTTAFTLGGRA